MSIYLKLYHLLSPIEKRKALAVTFLTLLMGFVDAIGAASIMPFMSLLSNPGILEKNNFLKSLKEFSQISSTEEFTFFIGICVFLLLVFSLSLKTFSTYAQVRFSMLRDYTFGRKLLTLYLSQPYSWYLDKNSSELGKNILDEINDVVKNGLIPLTNLISGLIIFISMISLIIIVEPFLAISIAVIFVLAYLITYKSLKKFISKIGLQKFYSNKDRYNAVNEVFGAIKEVKLSNLEEEYIKRFSKPSLIHAKNGSTARLIGALPRFILEIVAFGGMFIVLLYLLRTYEDINIILPKIALYAYAGYRILPSLQLVYSAITAIKYATPSINNLYKEFKVYENGLLENKKNISEFIYPRKSISLNNISFKYPKNEKNILKDLNIKIEANKVTGFVGFTGSGKTTLIDIILGLLEPNAGNIKIDNKALNKKDIKKWQNSIGYVPQNIYLADESIESNIAFGFNKKDYDYKRIREVAKIAEIDEFIFNELPEGYKTIVGERGIRLSGGQRQRLGIARALYKEPKILILDEATSALDNITEKNLMRNIYLINKKITILIIAHRLTTVEKCDEIFLLDKGQIIGNGTYYELKNKSKLFRDMINSKI